MFPSRPRADSWAGQRRLRSEDAIEHALVVVVLPSAPGVQRVSNHGQDDLHALGFRQVEVEALAQVVHCARAGLEAGASAGGHHLDQQDDAVRVLAARQEPLDAQHLRACATSLASAHAVRSCTKGPLRWSARSSGIPSSILPPAQALSGLVTKVYGKSWSKTTISS